MTVLSTDIDTSAEPAGAGGGYVTITLDSQPTSARDDLAAVFKEDAKAKEPDEKPEPKSDAKDDEKPEAKADDKLDKPDAEDEPAKQRADDGKFAHKEHDTDKSEQQDKGDRKRVEAPQSFMPAAKEVWRNTPQAVQAEVARMGADHAAAMERARETTERYESIRQYDDLARSNGRDLRESLELMTQVEDMLAKNPLAGLNAILQEIGPRKADGQAFTLREIAQYISQQDPQDYQRMVTPPAVQQREDPRIEQLQTEIRRMQEQQTHAAIVEPFKASHPRFDELSDDIAFFLQSDKVPSSLSAQERLAAAYDMAERINPPSYGDDDRDTQRPADRGVDERSSRSIKSSPGSVTQEYEPEAKAGETIGESLRREARRLNRA